jgi:hypothetical protein
MAPSLIVRAGSSAIPALLYPDEWLRTCFSLTLTEPDHECIKVPATVGGSPLRQGSALYCIQPAAPKSLPHTDHLGLA